jgi:exopolyphosphatase/guanosine-5'-triphosphate,3'-diphosphate pyrophosphatase
MSPLTSRQTAAVIDIGSNTIKLLVTRRGPTGGLDTVKARTLDARISAGISATDPKLSEEGMTRGMGAIRELLDEASQYSPTKTVLVATSAVRDAKNGAAFRDKILKATGKTIRILTGDEEASLIGKGLLCDPALSQLSDFYVFDLGGGSLECLSFKKRKVKQAISLPLGCVRLTEQFVKDPSVAFTAKDAVMKHVKDTLAGSAFKFDLGPAAVSVGTGGTLTAARAIRAADTDTTLERTKATIPTGELQMLLDALGKMTLEERQKFPGLPKARADVYPTALATVLALAEAGNFTKYEHSLYNLRWGLAAEAFGA